jgi:hypothetical protein
LSSPTALTKPQSASRSEVAIWAVVVVLAEWFALLGIPIALVLAFTRIRHNTPVARWGVLALAVAILAIQFLGLIAVGPDLDVSPPQRAN